jgi:hypothetical protein
MAMSQLTMDGHRAYLTDSMMILVKKFFVSTGTHLTFRAHRPCCNRQRHCRRNGQEAYKLMPDHSCTVINLPKQLIGPFPEGMG